MTGFNVVARLQLQGPTNLTPVISQIQSQLNGIRANINFRVNPNAAQNLFRLNSGLSNFNNQLRSTVANANNAARAINGLAAAIGAAQTSSRGFHANLGQVAAATQRVRQNTAQAADLMTHLGEQVGVAAKKFLTFTIAAGAISSFVISIAGGVKSALDFQKELIRLEQVGGDSKKVIGEISDEVTRLATSLGVPSDKLIKAASTLRQAGLSARETKVALEALAQSDLAPSFGNIQQTTEGVIAAMAQFKFKAKDLQFVLGSINEVSKATAAESEDLIEAIQRSGGAFRLASSDAKEAKVAFAEFLALFTSVRATTREAPESIATGLRTVGARLQSSSTRQKILDILPGTDIRDKAGQFIGFSEAVKKVGDELKRLGVASTDSRFADVVNALGGNRQTSKVIPALLETDLATKAYNAALTGQNSLTKDAAKAQEILYTQLTKTKEKFLELFRIIANDAFVQGTIVAVLKLADAFLSVAKAITPLIPLITAFSVFKFAGLARGFTGNLGNVARGFTQGRGNADGGLVPGVGNSDSVNARLMPGEFVINKRSADKIGLGTLRNWNNYANGGSVTAEYASGGNVKFKPDERTGHLGGLHGEYEGTHMHVVPDKYDPSIAKIRNLYGKGFSQNSNKFIGGLKDKGFEDVSYTVQDNDDRQRARERLFNSVRKKYEATQTKKLTLRDLEQLNPPKRIGQATAQLLGAVSDNGIDDSPTTTHHSAPDTENERQLQKLIEERHQQFVASDSNQTNYSREIKRQQAIRRNGVVVHTDPIPLVQPQYRRNVVNPSFQFGPGPIPSNQYGVIGPPPIGPRYSTPSFGGSGPPNNSSAGNFGGGFSNVQLPNRQRFAPPQAAGGVGNYIRNNRFKVAAVGAVAGEGLNYVGGQALGNEENPGSLGIAGVKSYRGAAGALGGAAAGASIGSSFGAYGTAIGALIGGFVGLTKALSGSEEELNKIAQSKISEKLDKAFTGLNKNTGQFGSSDLAFIGHQAIQSQIGLLGPQSEEFRNKAQKRDRELNLNQGSPTEFSKKLDRELDQLADEIRQKGEPAAQALRAQFETIAKANPGKTFDEILQQLDEAYRHLPKFENAGRQYTASQVLTKLNSPQSVAELKAATELANKFASLNKTIGDNKTSLEQMTFAAVNLSKVLITANDNFDIRQKNNPNNAFRSSQEGQATFGSSTGFTVNALGRKDLANFGAVGGGFDKIENALREALQASLGQGTEDFDQTKRNDAFNNIFDKKSGGGDIANKIGELALKEIENDTAGVRHDVQNGDLDKVVKKTTGGLQEMKDAIDKSNKELQAFFEKVGEARLALTNRQNAINETRVGNTNTRISEAAEDFGRGRRENIFSASGRGEALNTDIGPNRGAERGQFDRNALNSVFNNNSSRSRFSRRSGSDRAASRQVFGGSVVTPEEQIAQNNRLATQDAFVNTQQSFGLTGTRSEVTDADFIQRKIKSQEQKVKEAESNLAYRKGRGDNPEQILAASKDVISATNQLAQFNKALQNVASSTQILDAANQKLQLAYNREAADRNNRKQIGSGLAFGSRQSQGQFFQNEQVVQGLVSGQIGLHQLTDEQRAQVGQHLGQTRDVERDFQTGFTRKNGRTLPVQQSFNGGQIEDFFAQQTLGNFGIAGSNRRLNEGINVAAVDRNNIRKNRDNAQNLDLGNRQELLRKDEINLDNGRVGQTGANYNVNGAGQGNIQKTIQEFQKSLENLQLDNFNEATQTFNTSVAVNAAAIGAFGQQTKGLTDALNSFPKTINFAYNGKVEVIINGAETLAKIQGPLRDSIVQDIITMIPDQIKKYNESKAV